MARCALRCPRSPAGSSRRRHRGPIPQARWPATAVARDTARGARTVPPDARACDRSAAARHRRARRAATRPPCRSRRRRRCAACARYRG
ncbi:hypothetical protein FCJ61_34770 [Burkholderia metallica]|nr:hypothetical protein [Burkholderia metallica]